MSQPIGGTTYLSQFSYGPDHERWKQVASYSNGSETTHYIGGLLEKESPAPTGATQWRHYVYLPSGLAIIVTRAAGSAKSVRYVLTDHLGSTDRVLNEAGAVALSESFAAFGARRGSNWQDGTSPDWAGIAGTTRRGYTGHEHLDNLQLIHMNGRVYDPQAGRFLSVDPLMGDLGDSQQVNPYAYVGNRPLRATDPSGYSAADLPPDPGSFLGGVFDRMNARLRELQGPLDPYARYMATLAKASAAQGRKRFSAQDGGVMCGPGQSSLACAGIGTGTLSSPASPMAEYLPVAVEVGKTLLGFVPVVGQAVAVYEFVVVLRDPNSTSLDKVMAIVAVVPGGRAARGVKEGLEVIQDGRAVARVESAVARVGPAEVRAARAAPDFVVTPKGEAVRVPTGATGPTPTRAPGVQYTGGAGGKGLDSRVTGVRIMEGNANQGPRAVYMNRTGQTVDPATGRTVPSADPRAHQYLEPWP